MKELNYEVQHKRSSKKRENIKMKLPKEKKSRPTEY